MTTRPLARIALGAATALAAVAALAGATTAAAQGTLGTQGLGYPTGQLSTRALGLGGGTAETDLASPLNPSAVAGWVRGGLYFQYDPEFRRLQVGDARDRTTTVRFPVVFAALPVGPRTSLGLSASTLLDRTWETRSQATEIIGGDTVSFVDRYRVAGALSDVRLAGTYAITPRLAVGVAGHVLTGLNRVSVGRTFDDSVTFSPISSTNDLNYAGFAVSAGAQFRVGRLLALGVSGRKGARLRLEHADTVISRGTAPDRFGAGVSVGPVGGLTVAARADWTGWSSLNDLLSGGASGAARADTRGVDAWEFGGGVDLGSLRLATAPIAVRLGGRYRTLPFTANGAEVTEKALSGGLGIPLARGRAEIDLAVQRAFRTSTGDVRENAWTLSAGLAIRP